MKRGGSTGAALIALAIAAGVVAALAGGLVEDAFDWVFVGIPLCLLLVAYAVRANQRRRK